MPATACARRWSHQGRGLCRCAYSFIRNWVPQNDRRRLPDEAFCFSSPNLLAFAFVSDSNPSQAPSIIFFDGVCNLCQGSVQFIIKRDPHRRFRFAQLQSEAAAEHLKPHGVDPSALDSVVLLQDGRVYTEARAALKIAAGLRFPWPLLGGFRVLPDAVLNPFYRFVARRRYRWFGKSEHCMLPTPELKERFLD